MILHLTQPRLYVCQYVNSKGGISSFRFVPGDNKIPSKEAKFLLKHPGVKNRIDLGILVTKGAVTEDLAKEAQALAAKEAREAKEAEEAKAKAKAKAEASTEK